MLLFALRRMITALYKMGGGGYIWKQYYFRHEEIVSVRLDILPKQK